MADILFELRRRLQGVRRKERLVTWVAGLSRLCLWVLLLLALFFVVDIWIVSSIDWVGAYIVRSILTAVVLALMAWRAYVFLAKPLQRTLDDDLMALHVENAHPELRHRLISTLQLTEATDEARPVGSMELVEALQEDTITFTRAIEFPQVVKFKPAWNWLWKALTGLALAVGLCCLFPAHAQAFFKRLIFLPDQYPTRIHLGQVECVNAQGQVVQDADSTAGASAPGAAPATPAALPLAAGDTIHVRVYLTDDSQLALDDEGHFEEGALTYTYTHGPNAGVSHDLTLTVPKALAAEAQKLTQQKQGPGSGAPAWATFRKGLYWEAKLEAVTDSFQVRGDLDDGHTDWHSFTVLPRPLMRSIKVSVTPPSYMQAQMAPDIHDKTGDISAFQGSTVQIELHATQKLLHAQLQFNDPEPGQPLPQVVKLKEDTSGADPVWKGGFTVTRNTSYFIDLLAINGLSNPDNPPIYQVVSRIDPPPTVTVKFPPADDTVTLAAKYPIQFSAHDNFGLKAIRLRYKFGDDDSPEKFHTIDILSNMSTADYDGTYLMAIRDLPNTGGPLAEGDVITFWVEAKDGAPDDGPDRTASATPGLSDKAYTKNWARSNVYRLAIVTPAQKETELRQKTQEQLDLIKQQAEQIKQDRYDKVDPAIEGKPNN
ncbi:MAG: hypothetical protein ACREJ2_07295 [Planctomycetota bacterium]